MDIESNPKFSQDPELGSIPIESLPTEKSVTKFSITFWQKYFDLEEDDMKDRLKGCFYLGENSLAEVLDKDGDDLYGPYWIATTLIVVLFIGGKLIRKLVKNFYTS